MDKQIERLYQAAQELHGIQGQSELARFLNTSPQVVNNWESRGMSCEGILDAAEQIGCDAVWLRKGFGKMGGAA